MEQSDLLNGGWQPWRIITPHLPKRTCSLQSTGSSLWDFIPREAGTGITDQRRVNGRGGGGRGTGSRLWPWNRWSPKRHIQGAQEPLTLEELLFPDTSVQFFDTAHFGSNTILFHIKVWKSLFFKNSLTKSREIIKSVGQTAGHAAVKGYVNSSVPLHFSRAGRSLSTGPLPQSLDLKMGWEAWHEWS